MKRSISFQFCESIVCRKRKFKGKAVYHLVENKIILLGKKSNFSKNTITYVS